MGDIGVERREVVFEPVVAPDPEPSREPVRRDAPAPQPTASP
jgi:hypothetical protein